MGVCFQQVQQRAQGMIVQLTLQQLIVQLTDVQLTVDCLVDCLADRWAEALDANWQPAPEWAPGSAPECPVQAALVCTTGLQQIL